VEEKQIGTDVNQTEITSLNHIKGQPHIIELLRTSLDAYFQNRAIKEEKTTFGPVLLVGPVVRERPPWQKQFTMNLLT